MYYLDHTAITKFKGDPQRGRYIQWGGKIAFFDRNRRLSRKRYEIDRLLWIIIGSHKVPIDRQLGLSLSITLGDFERREVRNQVYPADTVWARTT